jgi:hypothetical protein
MTTTTEHTESPTYTVRNYKGHDTNDGVAFAVDIHKDGTFVGTAENDGCGGCNRYRFRSRDEQVAFVAYAKAHVDPGVTFEHDDWYLESLIAPANRAAELNRKRCVVFVLEEDYFDATGAYRTFPAKVTRERATAELRTRYADKHPKIWDKATSTFVTV